MAGNHFWNRCRHACAPQTATKGGFTTAHPRTHTRFADARGCFSSQKADADLIKLNRGPILTVIFGLGDFLRSRYFRNVRKSIGVFAGMWLWYVLNTKTYIPPEIEE